MADNAPNVLIVDDDEGLTHLIQRALKRQGIQGVRATTGGEALEKLEQSAFNLLLLDLKLPDIPTKELLDRISALKGSMPFIVITGQGDERVAVDMMKRGALDYLVKDAQFLEFVPIVVQRTLAQLHREARLAAAEAALQREHAFGLAVLKTAGTLMVVADPAGAVVSVNPACQRVTGYSLDDLQGKDFGEFFFAGTQAQLMQRQLIGWSPRSAPYEQEAYLTTKTGERRLIAWSITMLADQHGAPEYLIASGLDITDRRRLEQEILEVSDREQKRIGQDLHDGLCQVLAGVDMLAVVLKNALTEKGYPEAADADTISGYVRQAIAQARLVSRGLSPVELETHGLMAALEELTLASQKLFRIKCEFHCKEAVLIPDNAKATHLYRIAQEAISNAVKHGGAKTVNISLSRDHAQGCLSISDDGCGMTSIPEPAVGRGMGLRTMNYRAAMIGGAIRLDPGTQGGTTVICRFPLN